MNNIAEGFERMTNKEFKYFLYIAKGSSGEVRSMLYVGLRLNYFNVADFNLAYKLTVEISKCLAGLIKTL
jgi:four helix bundle protein